MIAYIGVSMNLLRGGKDFQVALFKIDGMGTKEGTENKDKTAKCFNTVMYFKYCKAILTVP